MSKNPYQQTRFIRSAAETSQLPQDIGKEIAFVGRSNAGKSSALNVICEQKRLAHTSKTPGRTQLINLFEVVESCRLVDLPGFGFAKVAKDIVARWQQVLSQYLQTRQCLCGLILIMDIRRECQELEADILRWAHESDLKIHILLSKADKFSRSQVQKSILNVQTQVNAITPNVSIQAFSSTKKTGVDECRTMMNEWFGFDPL